MHLHSLILSQAFLRISQEKLMEKNKHTYEPCLALRLSIKPLITSDTGTSYNETLLHSSQKRQTALCDYLTKHMGQNISEI